MHAYSAPDDAGHGFCTVTRAIERLPQRKVALRDTRRAHAQHCAKPDSLDVSVLCRPEPWAASQAARLSECASRLLRVKQSLILGRRARQSRLRAFVLAAHVLLELCGRGAALAILYRAKVLIHMRGRRGTRRRLALMWAPVQP